MKKHRFLKFIIALVLVFGITLMQHTPAAVADVPLDGAGTNTVHIDATYDPASRTYSIAGMSFEQLQAMNLPQFDDSTWNLLGLFDELSVKIIGNEIQVFTNETKLVSMAFDENARIFIYDIVNVFLEGSRIDRSRAEKWLDKADIEISLRRSKELSSPIDIDLSTLVQLKVNEDGALSIEGLPTGMAIQPEVLEMLKSANIGNAKICWNKGVINGEVNGAQIPQITIYQDGWAIIDQALDLNVGDISTLFDTGFGLGLVLGDGAPVAGECLP